VVNLRSERISNTYRNPTVESERNEFILEEGDESCRLRKKRGGGLPRRNHRGQFVFPPGSGSIGDLKQWGECEMFLFARLQGRKSIGGEEISKRNDGRRRLRDLN